MTQSEATAYIRLKACRHRLTTQQYKTLRGQILAGDPDGAMRGLRKLIMNAHEN